MPAAAVGIQVLSCYYALFAGPVRGPLGPRDAGGGVPHGCGDDGGVHEAGVLEWDEGDAVPVTARTAGERGDERGLDGCVAKCGVRAAWVHTKGPLVGSQARLGDLRRSLEDPRVFRDVYNFAYSFSCPKARPVAIAGHTTHLPLGSMPFVDDRIPTSPPLHYRARRCFSWTRRACCGSC